MALDLVLKTGFVWHPRGVAKPYTVRNQNSNNEDVTDIVIEFINIETGNVDYSTTEDTTTLANNSDKTEWIDLEGTTIQGFYWARATAKGTSTSTVYTSNKVLVYVDDYEFTYDADIPYMLELMYKGVKVEERGDAGTLYIPKNAGRVMVVFDDNTIAVLGPDDITNHVFERKGALVSVQEHKITFSDKQSLINYLENLLPEARGYIADKSSLTEDQIIQFYLPFYLRRRQVDHVVYIEYDDTTPAIIEHQLIARFGLLTPWSRGGGGGAGLALVAGLFALYEWYLHKHEEKTIKESADTIVNSVSETGKSISKQIQDTAVSIVQNTADSVWSISKDELIKKLQSIGASTRSEIDAIKNTSESAIWGPNKPQPWYKKPEVIGAMAFVGGLIIGKK